MNNQMNQKGEISVREAGHRGGEATSRTHGHEFYSEIGHMGGEAGGKKGGARVRELVAKGKRMEEEE